jgi:hypothetical protein
VRISAAKRWRDAAEAAARLEGAEAVSARHLGSTRAAPRGINPSGVTA